MNYSRMCIIVNGTDIYQPKNETFKLIKMLNVCCCFLFFLTDQLERVFLRLGHAETDEQLQDIISKFLPPVLLKLSSIQEGVRKKVRGVLSISLP